MKLKLYYQLELRDRSGKVVKKTDLIPSKSYVLQFLKFVRGSMLSIASVGAKDTSGNTTNITLGTWYIYDQGRCEAPTGDANYGLQVGTNSGSTSEANDNYKLDTQILHSATGEAGKLNHQAVVMVAPSVVAGNVDFILTRAFINETSAIITVKEIGVVIKNSYNTLYHLILRDVVSDFNVDIGYTLTVSYTLRTTV